MGIEHYQAILDKYGPPTNAELVSRAEAETYRGRLPDGLLEFWVTYGRGVWLPQGKFQLCDPEIFEPVLQDYFDGDSEFEASKFLVFGYNSFGKLYMTNGSSNSIMIESNFLLFSIGRFKNGPSENTPLDFFLARTLEMEIDRDRPWSDNDGNDMHEPALARLGPLAPGEMYGFFPAIAAGGDNTLDNLRKVRAREYHATLAALDQLKYFDWGFDKPGQGSRVIRMIGRQL
jgi:hypothetical protein